MDRTQLFRGLDSLSPSGINRDYLYRLPITDWEKLQGKAKANLRRPGDWEERGRRWRKTLKGEEKSWKGQGKEWEEEDGTKEELSKSQKEKDGKKVDDKPPGKEDTTLTDIAKIVAPVKVMEKVPKENKEVEKRNKKTETTLPSTAKDVRETVETEKTMMGGINKPETATTQEKAKVNLDHRKRTDEI